MIYGRFLDANPYKLNEKTPAEAWFFLCLLGSDLGNQIWAFNQLA
jgi:hypothetical protein